MSPLGTLVNTNVPFGLTWAVIVVPTTVTMRPGPFAVRNPLSLIDESADSAAPVTSPLIVAPLVVVTLEEVVMLEEVDPDDWVGADGDEEPQAPALSPA